MGARIEQNTSDDEHWLLTRAHVDGSEQEHPRNGNSEGRRTDGPTSSPESLSAGYDCDRLSSSVTNLRRIIQQYIGTA